MILSFLAACLNFFYSAAAPAPLMRILVVRRNRMGDMLCTLPLLQSLRQKYPDAHLSVACDLPGEEIARASGVVDEVIILKSGWNRWLDLVRSAAVLQNYTIVLAIKGGYDARLAALVQLTNAPTRIGFVKPNQPKSHAYSEAIPWMDAFETEHQIDVQLRLLAPLGIRRNVPPAKLQLTPAHRLFAEAACARAQLAGQAELVLLNLSSTVPLKFLEEDFVNLTRLVLLNTPAHVGLVFAPHDEFRAAAMMQALASPRVRKIPTPSPLDLAALLEKAALFLTPEGGAAHLASAMGTRTLVFWSEGPFQKWHTRHPLHVHVEPCAEETRIPVKRIWQAVEDNFLKQKSS